jgi:hypothetical protein
MGSRNVSLRRQAVSIRTRPTTDGNGLRFGSDAHKGHYHARPHEPRPLMDGVAHSQ